MPDNSFPAAALSCDLVVIGGGVAGAILTFIVGLVKNMMAGQPAR